LIDQPHQARKLPLRLVAVGAPLTTAALILTVVGCWPRQQVVLGDPHRLPAAGDLIVQPPTDLTGKTGGTTEISMRNVSYHVDDQLRLDIRRLRGRIYNTNGAIVVLDERQEMAVDVAAGEIALTGPQLSILLNRYVFGFKGSPLKDLVVRTEGDHIVQTGTMHKLIDIPFEMTATLSATDDGWIRIHPTKMEICSLDGEKLLRAVGKSLSDMLDLSGGKGVKVEGNDILMNPAASLPPPKINGKITAVRVDGDAIVQTYGPAGDADPVSLRPPIPVRNYIYFRGGTIRFGKLFMVDTDLLTVDADESDPFDFYFDYYHSQLVAGHSTTTANYGLIAYLVDFDDLGEKGTVGGGRKP
jgi:hypothetical protein